MGFPAVQPFIFAVFLSLALYDGKQICEWGMQHHHSDGFCSWHLATGANLIITFKASGFRWEKLPHSSIDMDESCKAKISALQKSCWHNLHAPGAPPKFNWSKVGEAGGPGLAASPTLCPRYPPRKIRLVLPGRVAATPVQALGLNCHSLVAPSDARKASQDSLVHLLCVRSSSARLGSCLHSLIHQLLLTYESYE